MSVYIEVYQRVLIFFLLVAMTMTSLCAFAEDDKTLKVEAIADNVYLHTSFKFYKKFGLVDSNGLVVFDGRDAYIIDTPWSVDDTRRLLAWVRDQGRQVVASISTHFHADRTAGIAYLNSQSIPTYTSDLTKSILISKQKALPSHTFSGDSAEFNQGSIEVYYPGAGHTQDNLVVWLPRQKILFGGCILRSEEWDTLGNVRDADIASWARSIENVQAKNYDAKIVVPGHGSIGTKALLAHTHSIAIHAANKLRDTQ